LQLEVRAAYTTGIPLSLIQASSVNLPVSQLGHSAVQRKASHTIST
jgi:hypothetical protein